jgi:hypothetical protein
MSLPMPPNVTFVVLRSGSPPSAAQAGFLASAYETGATGVAGLRYTHMLLADPGVDIRDGFNDFGTPAAADQVAVPDTSGTMWDVVFIDRPQAGQTADVVRVFLCRRLPTYPTQEF